MSRWKSAYARRIHVRASETEPHDMQAGVRLAEVKRDRQILRLES